MILPAFDIAVRLKFSPLVGDAVTTMNHSCFFQQFGLQEP
jgi:hypothetical protein